MKVTNRKLIAVVAIVAVVVLIAVAACQAPPPTGPTHVVLDNAYEIGASGEGPAGAAGDTNLTNLALSGNLTVDGAADIAGNPSYGAKDLRPVGNAANGKILVTGLTAAKVAVATVRPTVELMTTVTAFGCEPDDAAFNGAWDCRAAMGATNNITFTLYNVSATPVPTAAYDEIRYWVTGN